MIRAKQKQNESLANDRLSKELINSSIEEQVKDSIKNDNWKFTTSNNYYSADNDSDTEYTERNRPIPRPKSAKQASSNVKRRLLTNPMRLHQANSRFLDGSPLRGAATRNTHSRSGERQ